MQPLNNNSRNSYAKFTVQLVVFGKQAALNQ